MTSIPSAPLMLAVLLVGCSRAVPDPSLGSAIDPGSTAPEPKSVRVALDADPPLPGESREGWPGLVEPKPNAHHHHGHDHGKAAEPREPESPAQGGHHGH